MGQGRPETRGNNAGRRELSQNEITSPSEVQPIAAPSTTMGENNIPVTDSTSNKKVSNLITNNPFVPPTKKESSLTGKQKRNLRDLYKVGSSEKKKFKLPKLKFSGKGKRTAMRGKIK
jgi:hypothetical protein